MTSRPIRENTPAFRAGIEERINSCKRAGKCVLRFDGAAFDAVNHKLPSCLTFPGTKSATAPFASRANMRAPAPKTQELWRNTLPCGDASFYLYRGPHPRGSLG